MFNLFRWLSNFVDNKLEQVSNDEIEKFKNH